MVILADDLGYTDLGVTGGEIDTPNLDSLAGSGMLFTNVAVAPSCSPTRSMLMSGTDAHLAGLGLMYEMPKAPNQLGQPGYIGHLNDSVVAFPAVLQAADYSTFMVGKWHLGMDEGYLPNDRGFDQSFVMGVGGSDHFALQKGVGPDRPISPYFDNGVPVEKLPEGFYSTDFYTDRMIEYLGDGSEEPFFAYVAYTSPHWPLQAPEDWIDRYAGRYDEGYEVLLEQRIESMTDLGLFPENAPINEFVVGGNQRPWDSLSDEEKARSSRSKEIYAAMVANLDWNIGRLIDHLKETGEYDNTLILFLSDNGPDEKDPRFIWGMFPEDVHSRTQNDPDSSTGNCGFRVAYSV
ncbi:sulfatase-like hydrolase/transferase [Paracoccus aurantiacus]